MPPTLRGAHFGRGVQEVSARWVGSTRDEALSAGPSLCRPASHGEATRARGRTRAWVSRARTGDATRTGRSSRPRPSPGPPRAHQTSSAAASAYHQRSRGSRKALLRRTSTRLPPTTRATPTAPQIRSAADRSASVVASGTQQKREERVPEAELRNFAEPEDRRRRPFAAAPERGNESGESCKRDRERRNREGKGASGITRGGC